MNEHVINVQLRIRADKYIDTASLMNDLRDQLYNLQEQQPFRSPAGEVGWFIDGNNGVAVSVA